MLHDIRAILFSSREFSLTHFILIIHTKKCNNNKSIIFLKNKLFSSWLSSDHN